MGHREDLLAGAKRCLLEKGYARTTARDIVAASGTNLGSIGYHYGSVEALMNAALLAALEEWGQELGQALAGEGGPEAMWGRLIESYAKHRALWLASVEAFLVAERSPELRQQLAAGQQEGRRGLAAMLLGVEERQVPEAAVRGLGSVNLALFSGLGIQWLTDPTRAPSSKDVVEGLRALVGLLQPG